MVPLRPARIRARIPAHELARARIPALAQLMALVDVTLAAASCVSFRIDTRCCSRPHAWAAQAGARCSALAQLMALVRRGRDARRCSSATASISTHAAAALTLMLGRRRLALDARLLRSGRDACRCSCDSFHIDTRRSSRSHAWAAQAGARCSALAQLMALVRRGRDACRCSCVSFHIDTRCSMLLPSSLGWQHAPVAALLVHSCVVSNLALTSLRL